MISDIIIALAISLFCVPMSIEDWRTSLVSEFLCWGILVCCWVACILNGSSLVCIVVVLVITVLFILNREFKYVGDADLLCIAMYFSVFAHYGVFSPVTFMAPVAVLCLTVPYANFYARKHGIKWVPFSGMMLPAFPLISAGWWVATAAFIIYIVIRGV